MPLIWYLFYLKSSFWSSPIIISIIDFIQISSIDSYVLSNVDTNIFASEKQTSNDSLFICLLFFFLFLCLVRPNKLNSILFLFWSWRNGSLTIWRVSLLSNVSRFLCYVRVCERVGLVIEHYQKYESIFVGTQHMKSIALTAKSNVNRIESVCCFRGRETRRLHAQPILFIWTNEFGAVKNTAKIDIIEKIFG